MAIDSSGGDLNFEAELFKAADKLRGILEPSEYKHVALGLLFLKYISEAFEAQREKLLKEEFADPKTRRNILQPASSGAGNRPLVEPESQCSRPRS